jgi:hypothetical protein
MGYRTKPTGDSSTLTNTYARYVPLPPSLLFLLTQSPFKIFGTAESVFFHNLPELVNRFLAQSDPIILHYTINPSVSPPERPTAWDVEIKMEDLALKGRVNVMVQADKESMMELSRLDDEVCLLPLPYNKGGAKIAKDRNPRPIPAQRAPKTDLPTILRPRPRTIHPDLAGVAITRSGDRARKWAKRGRYGAGGGTAEERVLQVALG